MTLILDDEDKPTYEAITFLGRHYKVPTAEFIRIQVESKMDERLMLKASMFNVVGKKDLICEECLFNTTRAQKTVNCCYSTPIFQHRTINEQGKILIGIQCARETEGLTALIKLRLLDKFEVK